MLLSLDKHPLTAQPSFFIDMRSVVDNNQQEKVSALPDRQGTSIYAYRARNKPSTYCLNHTGTIAYSLQGISISVY
ncbi:MAG: hypothetical protein ACTS78_01910 [Arsenophonus sp. NC-WZS1-MAG3]